MTKTVLKAGIFLLFLTFTFSFIKPDYLEWDTSRKLSFADFKGSVPKGISSGSAVSLTTIISYETRQEHGKVPQMTILNLVDRNSSWIKVKKQGVLDLQQIKFDYSELYVRKIRKEMQEMNKKKIIDKQKYIAVISKIAAQSEKRQRANQVLLEEQPHLIKIMQDDVRDSLNLYKSFAK